MNRTTMALLSMGFVWGCTGPAAMETGRDPDGSVAMPGSDGGGGPQMADAGAADTDPQDARVTPEPVHAAGTRCACDAECAGTETHPGVCVRGICMFRATGACESGGSSAECPDGSRCWNEAETHEPVCWPDCATFSCDGTCDDDGSCVSPRDGACDPTCGSFCGERPCSPESPTGPCATPGEVCVDGACVEGAECPSWECDGPSCTELVELGGSTDPESPEALAAGYFIDTQRRYAFVRRDLAMLIQFAACQVARRFPGTTPIGISDLSQADGYTPGTDVGSPRHPTSTHRGNDMDLAYYQTDGLNDTQIVCGDGSDRNGNGTAGRYNDGYFCTTETNIVDWLREAYWFAMLATSSLVRVFGVDQTLPDDFRTHLADLLERGWITREQHDRATELGYGASGGWQFHHHHTHMSYRAP